MVLAYAGRRAQALGSASHTVAERIRRLLAELRPTAVVGAAADGADLLVLEASLVATDGPAVHVVLPTPREVFREDSVALEWRARFDAALAEVARRDGTIESLGLDPGTAAYRRANAVILERADALTTDAERPTALAIARLGEGRMIEDFLEHARRFAFSTMRIEPPS